MTFALASKILSAIRDEANEKFLQHSFDFTVTTSDGTIKVAHGSIDSEGMSKSEDHHSQASEGSDVSEASEIPNL